MPEKQTLKIAICCGEAADDNPNYDVLTRKKRNINRTKKGRISLLIVLP